MEHPRTGAMTGWTGLVTGAVTGIGRATAVGLATMGAHVAIIGPAPDVALVSGRYFAGSRPRRSSARSYDEDVAARLWAVRADLVGLTAAARG